MFIEKEPPKAAEAKKVKEAMAKEPAPEGKKKDLQGMGYEEQVKKVSPRAAAPVQAKLPAAPQNEDPVEALRRLFRENDLPDKLVPANALEFKHDPASGALTIVLKNGFSRKFDEENTVTFDRTISGVLQKGAFSGISGITKGNATITSMSRARAGIVAVRGKLGPFGKTMEFRDEALPSLP
jgi:hypothetical protein